MNVEDIVIGDEYYVNSPTAKGTWRAYEVRQDKNENAIVVIKRVTTRPLRGSDTRTVNPAQLIPKNKKVEKEKMTVLSSTDTELKLSNGNLIQVVEVDHTINTRGRRKGSANK